MTCSVLFFKQTRKLEQIETVSERNASVTVMERQKAILVASFIVIVLLYLVAIYFGISIESFNYARLNFGLSNHSRIRPYENATIVLFWTTLFDNKNFYFGTGDVISLCPELYDCLGTHDRAYADVEDFDAILFHHSQFSRWDLPETRNPRQSYIYVNLESPVNRPLNSFLEDFFNLTMTYRLDSDIPWPYGYVADLESGEPISPFRTTTWKTFHENTTADLTGLALDGDRKKLNRTGSKSKMVAWLVSNCHTEGKRENYVNELEKYIKVDKYGKCNADYTCPRTTDCFKEIVEPEYFFYLSFENSLCQDYVTEKLYNALRYNVVPVVYGGANYSLFAPPHSYIDALDFNSPKELADFLKKLSRDPATYETYFHWKRHYRLLYSTKRVACELCRHLRENNQRKVYNSLSTWYRSDKCPMQEELNSLMYATGALRPRN